MKFICAKHRQLLRNQPAKAHRRWQEWLDRGQMAMANKEWAMAIRFFGCCYEIAEMRLPASGTDTTFVDRLSPEDRLMLSGHLLAECFGRSGKRSLERHYLLAVHHHLTRDLAGTGPVPRGRDKNIRISLLMLERYCRLHGEFSGFSACREQGSELLAGNAAALH